MTDQAPKPETDLREYARILWRRKWSVLLIVVLVVGGAMFFSYRQTPVYTGTAKVLVTPIGAGENLAEPNMDTERGLVESASVASRVVHDLRLDRSPESLATGLHVSVETGTEILDIAYTDPSPAESRKLAQGFGSAYLEYRQERARESVRGQVDALQHQIALTQQQLEQVRGELRTTTSPARQDELSAQRDTLIAQLGALNQELTSLNSQIAGQTGGQVVQPAEVPTAPSNPSHLSTGVLALACGLVLGVGLAFLRERLDDRLRSERDIEQLGLPILAVVPRVPGWKRRGDSELVTVAAPGSAPSEAYRTFRTNLQFLGVREDVRVLCISSTSIGDGKTTTSANLAVSLAQAGRRIVLVSCDLRRPRLHRYFGADNESGLSTVLSGQHRLADAVCRLDLDTLRLLPSGPIPPNPAELLASDRLLLVLEELRGAADYVILDTPPVLAVSDTLTVAGKSDATVLVVDPKQTTRSALTKALQQLDQVGAQVSGVVLNNVDRWAGRQYGYGPYAYTYSENGGRRRSADGAGAEAPRKTRKVKDRNR